MTIELWAALIVAASVIVTGRLIIHQIGRMGTDISFGIGCLHTMTLQKLEAIEEEVRTQTKVLENVEFLLTDIEAHMRPEREISMHEHEVRFMAEMEAARTK